MLIHRLSLFAFLVALVTVSIAGEIFGLRVLICSKLDDSFLKKLILVSATYVAATWVMALIGIHLLHLRLTGRW
jgi:hypothetical protein